MNLTISVTLLRVGLFSQMLRFGRMHIQPAAACGFFTVLLNTDAYSVRFVLACSRSGSVYLIFLVLQMLPMTRLFDVQRLYRDLLAFVPTLVSSGDRPR